MHRMVSSCVPPLEPCIETKIQQFLHYYSEQWPDDLLLLQLIHVGLFVLGQKYQLLLLMLHHEHFPFVMIPQHTLMLIVALTFAHKT